MAIKRVLVADDEWHLRMMLTNLLADMNLEVAGEATNGQQMLEMYRQEKPDLVLLDVNMPVLTGEEAIAQLMQEFPDARVLMLTSVADIETVEACLDAGAYDYIRKDCEMDRIKEAIAEALQEDD